MWIPKFEREVLPVTLFIFLILLEIEEVCPSETLVTTYKITGCQNPEDSNMNAHCCENQKSRIIGIWFSLKFLHEITQNIS
jgi:hypothetical protein